MKKLLFLSILLIGSSQAMEQAKSLALSAGVVAAKTTVSIVRDCSPAPTTFALIYCAYVGGSAIKDYLTRK